MKCTRQPLPNFIFSKVWNIFVPKEKYSLFSKNFKWRESQCNEDVLPQIKFLFRSQVNYYQCSDFLVVFEGVQVLLREYDFKNRKRPTFTEDDIMNLFPIVKHTNPKVNKWIIIVKNLMILQRTSGLELRSLKKKKVESWILLNIKLLFQYTYAW